MAKCVYVRKNAPSTCSLYRNRYRGRCVTGTTAHNQTERRFSELTNGYVDVEHPQIFGRSRFEDVIESLKIRNFVNNNEF